MSYRNAGPPDPHAGYSRQPCSVFFFDQSYAECAHCYSPYWWHSYEAPGRNEPALFHVRQWDRRSGLWRWIPVGAVITRKQADEARESEEES